MMTPMQAVGWCANRCALIDWSDHVIGVALEHRATLLVNGLMLV